MFSGKVLQTRPVSHLAFCMGSNVQIRLLNLEETMPTGRKQSMELCQQLKVIIDDYFSKYPNMSINSLALRSNVGASTLRRILAGSIKGDPSPHTVLNIASAVAKEKRLRNLIEMFEGPVGEVLKETFSPYAQTDAPHVYDVNLNELLKDRISYFVYKLSSHRNGVSEWEVVDLFGTIGRDRLLKLEDRQVLTRKDERYFAKEPNFSLDLETAAEHLPELVKFYQPEELDRGQNLFYSLSESLNEEGIKKVKEIQKEAVQKIYAIMNDTKYDGDIPYFSVQVCDTLRLTQTQGVLQ